MKRILLTILSTALSIGLVRGALILTWDQSSPDEMVTGYIVYERIGTNWIKVATTSTNFWKIEQTSKMRVFAVTATNQFFESPFSVSTNCPAVLGAVEVEIKKQK